MIDALAQLVTESRPTFLGLAKRYLPKGMDPEDCVQDAAVQALRFSNQFRGDSQLSTWFGTIVRNCALMRSRRLRNDISLEQSDSNGISLYDVLPVSCLHPDELDPDARIDQERRLSHLWSLINAMPWSYRSVFMLAYVEGLPLAQIAEILEIPEGTVKARLSRGKVRLRKLVKAN